MTWRGDGYVPVAGALCLGSAKEQLLDINFQTERTGLDLRATSIGFGRLDASRPVGRVGRLRL
jgi:hypothetical protein